MNIQELSSQFQIKNDTKFAIEEVCRLTDKPIRFHIVDDLMSHAVFKAARTFMDEHIIYIRREKVPFINHLIVHECHHAFRFWSVFLDERKIFSSTHSSNEERILKWKNELGSKQSLYPPQIFEMWNKGIMTLLYNVVTDTRIERDIYYHYPQLKDEQTNSLKSLENEVKQTMSKQIQKMIPYSLYYKTGAMNYAFMSLISPIIGKSWKKSYKGHNDIASLGQKLLKTIPEKDGGLNQDIELINQWAKLLDIKGVKWLHFDDVPPNYEKIY